MWKPLGISKDQYVSALKAIALTDTEKLVLNIIYQSPSFTATPYEVAAVINPTNPANIVANKAVGSIGKKISQFLKLELPLYDDDKPAYFLVVGPYYTPEGKKGEKSGWEMQGELVAALEEIGIVQITETITDVYVEPGEIYDQDAQKFYQEGKLSIVLKNKYERNRAARAACISHYGTICTGCGFSFVDVYGKIAGNFIEVHHIVPLSTIKRGYKVDPIKDLVPLCSNCHSVIHLVKPALTVDELKKILNKVE